MLRTILQRGLLALLVALGLGAGAWFERGALLRAAANLWIVSDPVGPADAAAVLGGGVEDRPFAAAKYYKEGLVKAILISNAYQGSAEKLGIILPEAEADRKILLKLGVPANAIETFGIKLRNTHQEALALHTWAEQRGIHSLIVPTEIFSARRVRWILRRVFGPGTTIRVPALEPADYNQADWWKDSRGILAFQNEILKYLYYRVRY